jgi:hypothetical protein
MDDIGIVLLVIVAGILAIAFWVHNSEKRQQAGPTSRARETSKITDQVQAVIAKLQLALAEREEIIRGLREKGRRAVADRDRWEAAAKNLQ